MLLVIDRCFALPFEEQMRQWVRHATEETARNTVGVRSGAAIETCSVFCLCAKMEKTEAEIVAKIIILEERSPH